MRPFPKLKPRMGREGLFQLNAEGPNSDYDIDVVAVHGLNGHWERTWTHSNGKLWLRDFLPSQLRDVGINVRVMSYGFDSRMAFSRNVGPIEFLALTLLDALKTKRTLQTEEMRPMILVAHSTGGIIVKKALILAHERASLYGTLSRSVHGLIFFGTPHTFGDDLAAKSSNFGQVGMATNPEYIEDLRILADISQQFKDRASGLEIRTFYETEKTLEHLIVDKEAARLGMPNEISAPLESANHDDLCKFGDGHSQSFEPVWEAFLALCSVALRGAGSRLKQPLRPFLVPFSRDPNFVGREDIIKEIDAVFKSEHRVALAGIGGIGKSQIAIEYCYRFRDVHPDAQVFWVNAGSTIRFKHAYSEIARRFKLKDWDTSADPFRSVYDWFRDEANGRWLLVLDDADDPRVLFDSRGDTQIKEFEQEESGIRPLAAYVPQTASGSILVTSRDRNVAFRLTNNERSIIKVDSMGPEETLSLVQSRLVDDKSSSEEKKELIECLDFIPLAITQAAAFINSEKLTVPQYSELILEATNERLLVDTGVPNSFIRTWYLSFDLVNRDAPAAAHLMSLMCAFDEETVPEFFVRDEYKDALEFENVLAPLIDFSLISVISTKEGGRIFAIHRLVRIAMAKWLEKHDSTAKYREEALLLLKRHFSKEDDLETDTSAVLRQDRSHLLSNEPESLHASEIMETASIMSIEAPSLVSATTLPSAAPAEDAAQEFAVLLFHDEVLHPLLFEASRKVEIERLKRNFAKLLYIYAGDLREEAAEVLEKAAVELVRNRIHYITSCVWDFFGPTKDSKSQAMDELLVQTSKREDRLKQYLQNLMTEDIYPSELPVIESMQGKPVDEIFDEDSEPPEPTRDVNFIHVRKFLTDSVAFAKLRQNFRDFLTPEPKSMQPPPSEQNVLDSAIKTPPQTPQKGIGDTAKRDTIVSDSESSLQTCALDSTYFHLDLERYPLVLRVCSAFIGCILWTADFLELRDKPLKNGMKRARWQCVCGRELYEDFYEIIPGAVRDLEKSLDFSHNPDRNFSPENGGSTSAGPQGNTGTCQESTPAQVSHTISIHPTESQQHQLQGTVVRRRRKGLEGLIASDEAGKWILPVFQEKRYGAKAVHLPVKHINSDETLFIAMKKHYFASTTRLHRWFSMRDVKKIHHVKFVLTYRGADVNKLDDWPPQQFSVPKGQWIYEGCHAEIKRIPLVGNDYMMHIWQNPHHTSLKTYNPGVFERARDALFKVRTRYRNYLRDRVSRPSNDPASGIPDPLQDRPTAAAARNGEARHDHEGSSTNRHDETADVELQATEPPRDCFVLLHTAKKLGEQLTPDDRDPPEGWGIYFEEGFCIPPFFVVVYCVCVLGSLALAVFLYHTYGLAAFGAMGWVVGLLSLVAMVLFKWAD